MLKARFQCPTFGKWTDHPPPMRECHFSWTWIFPWTGWTSLLWILHRERRAFYLSNDARQVELSWVNRRLGVALQSVVLLRLCIVFMSAENTGALWFWWRSIDTHNALSLVKFERRLFILVLRSKATLHEKLELKSDEFSKVHTFQKVITIQPLLIERPGEERNIIKMASSKLYWLNKTTVWAILKWEEGRLQIVCPGLGLYD